MRSARASWSRTSGRASWSDSASARARFAVCAARADPCGVPPGSAAEGRTPRACPRTTAWPWATGARPVLETEGGARVRRSRTRSPSATAPSSSSPAPAAPHRHRGSTWRLTCSSGALVRSCIPPSPGTRSSRARTSGGPCNRAVPSLVFGTRDAARRCSPSTLVTPQVLAGELCGRHRRPASPPNCALRRGARPAAALRGAAPGQSPVFASPATVPGRVAAGAPVRAACHAHQVERGQRSARGPAAAAPGVVEVLDEPGGGPNAADPSAAGLSSEGRLPRMPTAACWRIAAANCSARRVEEQS